MMHESLLEFVYLRLFDRSRQGILLDEEMKVIEDELLERPEAGALIGGTGGVRKIRAARGGRGKRGGARILYLYVEEQQTVYFLLAFAKNVQANLTGEQKSRIRALAAAIRDQPWPRLR